MMKSLYRIPLLLCIFLLGSSSLFANSEVCRFTLPRGVEDRWDMEVILFYRDGTFHHGYALVPQRDNVPHRVDVTPSKPIQWRKADDTTLEVPERMRGYYSYTLKEEFSRYKHLYQKGEIKIAYPIPTPPIEWNCGRLTGNVDVLVAPVNVANKTGRGPLDTAYRIRLNAKGEMGGTLNGKATWWTYENKDDNYGADAEKTTVNLKNARWDTEYWKPTEGTSYAGGTDWPQARGPMLNGAAADCKRPLMENLDDAKLLWVGEEIIGGGRGAVLSRGGFAMYPYAWQNIGYGAFAGVTVAEGKVFQYLTHPDEERVARDGEIAGNVYVQLGADPRTMANDRGHMRDTVLCLDARTGKTLWWFKSERTFGNVKSGKGGVGMTACYYKGRLYARGSGGLYCLDPDAGRLLWNKSGEKKSGVKVGYGPSGGWSHDESPVIIGGVLVFGHGGNGSLAGVNPADGSLLWTHDQVKGQNAVATKVVLDEKEYIIVCSKETAKLSLIDPNDGRILWQSEAMGPNHGSLSVWSDVVCGNGKDRESRKQGAARAMRVSKDGAKLLWTSTEAGYPPHRSVPVAHKGYFYVDDREGFFCLDAGTGELINHQPHIYKMTGGSHNWVWTITSNQRVITSGILMFSTAEGGFNRMQGRLSLDLADGYTCPIKPAMADGRLFCRLSDKIVCYDLRKMPKQQSKTIELTAVRAFASSTEKADPVKLRVRILDGEVMRAAACWPEVVGPEADRIAEKWASWYKKPLRWRLYPSPDLKLSSNELYGKVRLPMGWHFENWTLKLNRDGRKLSGTFNRSIPNIDNPLQVQGAVSGSVFDLEQGQCYAITLEAAATQGRRSEDRRSVNVVVVKDKQGVRAWAVAGKINSMAHEVDPSKLTIGEDGKLRGEVTVIFRDDPYFHLNQDAKTSVAGKYEINATIKNGKIEGKHRGTFGHAWSRQGEVSGRII